MFARVRRLEPPAVVDDGRLQTLWSEVRGWALPRRPPPARECKGCLLPRTGPHWLAAPVRARAVPGGRRPLPRTSEQSERDPDTSYPPSGASRPNRGRSCPSLPVGSDEARQRDYRGRCISQFDTASTWMRVGSARRDLPAGDCYGSGGTRRSPSKPRRVHVCHSCRPREAHGLPLAVLCMQAETGQD